MRRDRLLGNQRAARKRRVRFRRYLHGRQRNRRVRRASYGWRTDGWRPDGRICDRWHEHRRRWDGRFHAERRYRGRRRRGRWEQRRQQHRRRRDKRQWGRWFRGRRWHDGWKHERRRGRCRQQWRQGRGWFHGRRRHDGRKHERRRGCRGSTGGTGGNPTQQPDCNAQMPSGGTLRTGQGTGGTGNLAWEIWSNTQQGQLTTYSAPAFIAAWNNSGGYLGRLGFKWNRFGDDPVPHTQRGTITAQFVSRKTGTAGGYSYVGMYGWTINPCVEWYVVDDSYNTMPINPGGTTNRGERQIDGGTYIMYTRPTTGTGGTRCTGVTNWIQYYSVRRTARACGVISLTEHFNAWQSVNMDMTGDLLEARSSSRSEAVSGTSQLPIANVTVR